MSMLQQILDKMFVDPEILNALDEEQKQILFIKMREEQVKRWKIYEENYEKENPVPRKRAEGSRRIQWLKGSDGEVWVWVMGEHKDDLSLEEIIEKRDLEAARQLAEKEMLESIRLTELEDSSQPCLFPNEDESTLKQQLSRMGMHSNANVDPKAIQESTYDDADALADLVDETIMSSPSNNATSANVSSAGNTFRTTVHDSPAYNANSPLNGSLTLDSANLEGSKSSENAPPLPVRPPRVKHLAQKKESDQQRQWLNEGETQPLVSNSLRTSQFTQRRNIPEGPAKQFETSSVDIASDFAPNISSLPAKSVTSEVTVASFPVSAQGSVTPTSAARAPDSVVPRASTSWENKSATVPARIGEASAWQTFPGVKMRANAGTRAALAANDEEISKRQSEIFEMMKEKHLKFMKEAELEAERARHAWEEQERKAREAEAQIRQIAQKAREQHRQQSLRTSTSILPALKDTNASSLREAIKNLPRPPKPKSRQAIVDWFRVEELQRGTGLDPKTRMPAPWFHGIITRDQADELLRNKPSGSFLVRVSERIWGYTVSYVVGEGNTKHFLIERIPQGYQFLGTNQVVHDHLYDLITYHETAPITMKGNEILKWAVGQTEFPPDYADLITDPIILSGFNAHTLPSSFYRRF